MGVYYMKKKKKVLIGVLIILIIALVCGGVYLNKDKLFPKEEVPKVKKPKGDSVKKDEPYKEKAEIESPQSEENEKVEIKYDQYITASGYAGASDNVYYTRNNTLYHLTLSTNTSEVIAEGVKKIEEDIDTILVYKGDNFKEIKTDNYLTYID